MKDIIVTGMTVEPTPGAHIDKVKEEVKALAKQYKCRIKFYHNSSDYICDSEGNIAKTN